MHGKDERKKGGKEGKRHPPYFHTSTPPYLHTSILWSLLLLLVATGCSAMAGGPQEPRQITVSAASSLTPAFEEIGDAFTAETGTPVTFNFASSGQLAQQIEEGAPVDVFASADVTYVDEIAAQGLVVPGSQAVYARGRLTLWTPAESDFQIEQVTDLADPRVERVAIANPDVAPYGHAAREALQAAGVWEAVRPKLVIGENVRQAFQYGETENVDVVLAPLSLSIRSDGHWVVVPEDTHAPIEHALAVVKDAPNETAARDFVDFLLGSTGRSLLEKHGLRPPTEDGA